MSPSVFDEAIKQLVHCPVDVCYTDILVPGFHRFPWNGAFAARKWSKLISAKRFKPIRQEAQVVFTLMEEHRVMCPTVTVYNPVDENGLPAVGLQLEWKDDQKVLRVFLAADHPPHYARGRTSDGPMPVNFVEDLAELLAVLPIHARFISPPSEFKRSA